MFPSERQEGNGSKKLQQEAYRASLERQVEQKSRRMVEEERKLNTHPFGPNYEQPKPSFWQTSKRARPNCESYYELNNHTHCFMNY